MKPAMKKIRLAAALTAGATLIAGAASGCTSSSGTSTAGGSSLSSAVKYGGVLRVTGSDPMPDNFNPLDPAGTSGTASGTGSVLYEPLIYDNSDTGKLTDMLATGYQWSNRNKTLTFTIRQGVKWSDGTPFSAADVAFTFNLLKKYPALDGNGFWKTTLSSVTAPSSDTVVFQFSAPYTVLFTQIVGQEIIPEHIWSKITNPVTYTNPDPVGTGPFLLKSYGPSNVIYVKNPHYWMPGRPYIAGIDYEGIESDSTEELQLLDGSLDYAYDALTDPEKTFVAADPSTNHYWWPVGDLNFLYFNTTMAPFNTAYFRQAVAMTINDNVVAERAYFGAIPPANGAEETGVTNGQVNEWIPSSLTNLEWSYDPAAALKLLESHGYKLVGGSLEAPGGKVLPTFSLLIGTGWTDFISMAQTISQELLQLGIHTTLDEQPYSTYAANSEDGNYQLMISWGNGSGPTPYYMYYYLLSPNESAPIGKDAATNWERYTNPAVTAALTQYSKTSDLADQKEDILQIEKNVLENVPVVALTGRPNFGDYSTREFTGFPSASDPYNDADPTDGFGGGAEMMYLNVHSK
jgi:peptide/nickel transport system substrate-binding protein